MRTNVKIWHLFVLILSALILLKARLIMNVLFLLITFVELLISNPVLAVQHITLNLLDYFFSIFLLISLPIIFYLFRHKIRFLFYKAGIINSIFTLLVVFILITPIAAPSHYDFQYNISISKLMPPLSVKKIINFHKTNEKNSLINNFVDLRNEVNYKGISGNFIIADSIKINKDIVIFQKLNKQVITYDEVISKQLKPDISTKIFLLGTDEFGRDIFSRLIYGTRLSLFVGFSSVLLSLSLGLLLGFSAGYFGRFADIALNRTSDIFLSFPIIFLIILIVALFGNSIFTVIIVLGFSGWMNLFKIVRSEVASLKYKDYIITSRQLGFSNSYILLKEMLPIMLPSIIVTLVLQYGNVIIAESALSYLGLGLGNNYPSWGAMIEAGQSYLAKAWWISFFPCLFLFFTLLTANHFGNKLKIRFNLISDKVI